jgi:hypothetical protein
MNKHLFLFSIILVISSCESSPKHESADFQFLLGDWVRINNQIGYVTFESWTKDKKDNYLGFGYTLQGEDTVFKEYMRVIYLDSAYYFEVEGVNEEPTFFYVDKMTKNAFSCVNEENEFPKKIAYSLEKDELIARISDDSIEVKFTFRAQ